MGHKGFTVIMQVWCLLIIACSLVLCEEAKFLPPMTNITQVYNCTAGFVPETQTIVCEGKNSTVLYNIFYHLEFKVLMEVPLPNTSQPMYKVGLYNFTVKYFDKFRSDLHYLTYSLQFDSSVSVAALTGRSECEHGKPCNISILDEIFGLPVFSKQFRPWEGQSLWNFSSPVFGVGLKWLQGLTVQNGHRHIILSFLRSLQNTSIESLSVTGLMSVDVINLKYMPLLKTINLASKNNLLLHHECFIGTPQVESVIIQEDKVKRIPALLTRLPNLQYLKFSSLNFSEDVLIATKELSALHNLESLSLENMAVTPISFSLPNLPGLKKLTLSKCQISVLEENDFVNFPALQELNLSGNKLPSLKKNTFMNLQHLQVLDLSQNKLLNWPVLYQCSLKILDLSQNSLEVFGNLGRTGTTVEFLNISMNKIFWWQDEDVFSENNFGFASPIIFPYTHPDANQKQNSFDEYDENVSNAELLGYGEAEIRRLCSNLLEESSLHINHTKTEDYDTVGEAISFLKKLDRLKNLTHLGSSAQPFNHTKIESEDIYTSGSDYEFVRTLDRLRDLVRYGSAARSFSHTEVENADNNTIRSDSALDSLKNFARLSSSAQSNYTYGSPETKDSTSNEENDVLMKILGCSRYSAGSESSAQLSETETNDNSVIGSDVLWVKSIDLSNNKLFYGLSEGMIQSLAGLQHLDLGGNPFNCASCQMLPFQTWLNSTSTNVTNFGTSNPLQCLFPPNDDGLSVLKKHFDPCPESSTNVGMIVGISVGVVLLLICIVCGLVYKYKCHRPETGGFTQF